MALSMKVNGLKINSKDWVWRRGPMDLDMKVTTSTGKNTIKGTLNGRMDLSMMASFSTITSKEMVCTSGMMGDAIMVRGKPTKCMEK